MKPKLPPSPYFIPIAVIGVAAAILLITMISNSSRSDATSVPASYQEQNLKSLRLVQPNDLVLCVSDKPGTTQPEIKFAFLVEQNKGEYMTGYHPSQYTLSRADGGESFSLLSEWKCEIRILRPSETRAATDMLASIILYGLNPR